MFLTSYWQAGGGPSTERHSCFWYNDHVASNRIFLNDVCNEEHSFMMDLHANGIEYVYFGYVCVMCVCGWKILPSKHARTNPH